MEQTARACPNCHTPLPTNAAFCYVCGTATPAGIDRDTGEFVSPESTGVTMVDLLPRLRAALGATYELGERIGSGGFAEVYAARDVRLKREVAVKVTRPEFAVNAQMMLRFRREAETIAALRHPHIMPIYDIGEAAGLAFIVMPFVHGESLKSRLDREGRLPVEQVRKILLQAADALASAHEAGVVHRDVKPDNIMLDRREDHVLLMDFGIAKAAEAGADVIALTSTGLVMGTPHYMSPEQAAGERSVDARADQYALAVIAYRMLAGVLPFDGPTVRAVLAKQLLGVAAPLHELAPDAPAPLVAAVERALSKDPDARFPSVREFVAALRADPSYAAEVLRGAGGWTPYTPSLAGPAIPATPAAVGPVPAASAAPARGRRGRWAAGALVVLGVGAGGVALQSRREPPSPPPVVDSTLAVRALPPAAAPRAESSAAPAAPPAGDGTAASIRVPDSVARRLADDSARVRRAGLAMGTPAADSFLVRFARSRRRSCERTFAAGDWAEAAAVCGAVARLGQPAAHRTLGVLAERAGRFDSAAAWYGRAARQDVDAAVRLARLLDEGHGVPADPARATTLLTAAAARGSLVAQRTLGARAARGLPGVPRDDRAAAGWYQSAAAAGDVPSMVALGEMLDAGRGVKKNEREAVAWWTIAAEKGDAGGQYWLGRAYLSGHGVDRKSDSLALAWLRKAAAQGHDGAKYEVAKRERRP